MPSSSASLMDLNGDHGFICLRSEALSLASLLKDALMSCPDLLLAILRKSRSFAWKYSLLADFSRSDTSSVACDSCLLRGPMTECQDGLYTNFAVGAQNLNINHGNVFCVFVRNRALLFPDPCSTSEQPRCCL